MDHTYIRVENVGFAYQKEHPVLKNVSFTMKEKESIGIIGANGVGKSTLLKLLVGLEPDFTGRIDVDGISLEKRSLSRIREKIGYVFQDADNQLFLTDVYQEIAFAPRNYGIPEEEVKHRVTDALNRVHIMHLKDKQVYQLSGGEKKLVSIATVLSMMPDLLLMDEPSVALDPKNRRNLIRILNEITQPKIITSHDLDFIWDTCGRTLLMADGAVAADGPTQEILRDGELLEANGLELPLSLSRRG